MPLCKDITEVLVASQPYDEMIGPMLPKYSLEFQRMLAAFNKQYISNAAILQLRLKSFEG